MPSSNFHMLRFLRAVPKYAVTALIILAITNLLVGVIDGSVDPSQPVFRENLDD